jgi:hypothetical protein
MKILLDFEVLFVEAKILQQLLKEVSCSIQTHFPLKEVILSQQLIFFL